MFRVFQGLLSSSFRQKPPSLQSIRRFYGEGGVEVERACAPERLDPRIVDPQVRKGKRVVVGVSGGVDSSVSLLMMQKMGFDVIALHMVNWDQSEEGGDSKNLGRCSAIEDQKDAEVVCEKLGIPLHTVHYVKEYWNQVFQPSLDVWQAGGTPNPDVLCNREIKFKSFLHTAIHQFGADFIAMGHYCQKQYINNKFQLLKGVDPGKDQSYFLSLIKQDALSRALFPLGGLYKSQVRRIAKENDLSTAQKRDSVGLCFVGKRKKFHHFLSQYVSEPRGPIFRIDTMEHVGDHGGLSSFTIGERSRIQGQHEALFVCGKDPESNTLYTCPGKTHPLLGCSSFVTSPLSWISEESPVPSDAPIFVSCRYQQRKSVQCSSFTEGILSHHPFSSVLSEPTQTVVEGLRVMTDTPITGVAPGQTAVFYQENVCLGGGLIVGCVPTHELPHFTTENPLSNLTPTSPPAWAPTDSSSSLFHLSFGNIPEPWNQRKSWRQDKKKKKWTNKERKGTRKALLKEGRGMEVVVSEKRLDEDFYLD